MTLYLTKAGRGAAALAGLYVEEAGVGDLGISRRWRKAMPFIYGAAAMFTVQSYLAPSIKKMLEAYRAKRAAARTAAELEEVRRLRSQMMAAAPELFSQQPGLPSPAEIIQAIEAAPPGQPIPVGVIEQVPTMAPVVEPEPEPVKKPIPVVAYIAGGVGLLTAAKLLGFLS